MVNGKAIDLIADCLTARGVSCTLWESASENIFDATTEALLRYEAESLALKDQGETMLLIKPDLQLASKMIEASLPRMDMPLVKDMQRVAIIDPNLEGKIKNCIKEARIIDGKALLTSLLDEVKDRIAALHLRWAYLESADPKAAFLGFCADGPLLFARFPTPNPWELPAYFSLDQAGFQQTSWEIAVFRYWHERYAATPLAVSSDSWHLSVERPAQSIQDAVELMLDQIAFCPSLLSFADHADFRNGWALDARRWGFWWPTEHGKKPDYPRQRSLARQAERKLFENNVGKEDRL